VRAAVLGSPVAHSLSPRLHRAAYAALGLDWTYDAVEMTTPRLEGFLAGLGPEWAGLSLTMPLKQAVLPLLDEVTPLAAATGAANTVVLRDGRRLGSNTDVAGIVAALREAGVEGSGWSLVLGGGATAASALAALVELGDDAPNVQMRDPARSGPLRAAAARLGVRPVIDVLDTVLLEEPGLSVVVNTTPAGALDRLVPGLRLPSPAPVLLDVVYDPWPTALAAAYLEAGATVVPGTAMLLHQAVAQVEQMTGRTPPLEPMRAALPA